MKRVLCSRLPARGNPTTLSESEAHHLTRVLRHGDGAKVEAMDGNGRAASVILRVRGETVFLELDGEAKAPTRTSETEAETVPLRLEVAILKGDAMEWVVEKAVELGVRQLQPVMTAHTVVQIRNKGPETFQGRWQKISDQALKQCGRLNRMEVLLPCDLEDLLAQSPAQAISPRLWADEAGRENAIPLGRWISTPDRPLETSLLIGPEGGWSEQERELLSRSGPATVRVSLGPLVLRAETAAIFGISLLASAYRSGT